MKNWWLRIHRRWLLLRQLQSLNHWWLFLRILLFALSVPALMYFRLQVLSALLERRLASTASPRSDPTKSELIIRFVDLAINFGTPFVRPKCLTRSLTLYYFLRRAGLKLSLCFGARLRDGELTSEPGHCWLLQDGIPFLENNDTHAGFIPIFRIPESCD